MSQICAQGPEGYSRPSIGFSKVGVYSGLPKIVMGLECPQHRSIKIIEVLKHYYIPCTTRATKRALLQSMVALQRTLTDAEIDVIKDWLLVDAGNFEEAVRARKPAAQQMPVEEEWEVYDPAAFDDDSDTESVIFVDAVEEQTRDCRVCLESFPTDSFLQESISPFCTAHREDHKGTVCINCIEQHIAVQIADPEYKLITCPICRGELESNTIRDFSTREAFDSYTFKRFKASIERMEGYMKCLAPNCESGQIHPNGIDQPIMTCVDCGFQSCYNHKLPWHEGQTCAEYDYVKSGRLEEEQATQKTLEKISKVCPNSDCGIHIEKKGGCNHVTCKKCEHEFCWLCLRPWENHGGSCKSYSQQNRQRLERQRIRSDGNRRAARR